MNVTRMVSAAAGFKVPKQKHKAADAASKMIRVSGEVISVADAVKRTGRTRHNLLALYREGRRTWTELDKRP